MYVDSKISLTQYFALKVLSIDQTHASIKVLLSKTLRHLRYVTL